MIIELEALFFSIAFFINLILTLQILLIVSIRSLNLTIILHPDTFSAINLKTSVPDPTA